MKSLKRLFGFFFESTALRKMQAKHLILWAEIELETLRTGGTRMHHSVICALIAVASGGRPEPASFNPPFTFPVERVAIPPQRPMT